MKASRKDIHSTGKNMLDKQGTSDTSVGRPLGSLVSLCSHRNCGDSVSAEINQPCYLIEYGLCKYWKDQQWKRIDKMAKEVILKT